MLKNQTVSNDREAYENGINNTHRVMSRESVYSN
jgi:hypothetical protein